MRSEQSVNELVARTVAAHGRLDALVYNSGAIFWASVADTPLKRFQLMQRVNPEGLYAVVQAALPHLRRAPSAAGGPGVSGGRIVVVSPPIYSRFFRGKTAYAMGKIGMSVLTKGLAMDLLREGERSSDMAITSIWPAVVRLPQGLSPPPPPPPPPPHARPRLFADGSLAVLVMT